MDVLSDVLNAVRLTGAIYFDIDAGAPWVGESPSTAEIAAAVMPGSEHVISFHAVISGSCWASLTDGTLPPIRVDAGDVVVFPGGARNVMSSWPGARAEPNMAMYYRPIDENLPFTMIHGGGEERTRFICGYLGCDARPFNPLLSALPPILCARRLDRSDSWVTDLFRVAIAEGASRRTGGETVLAKLSELLFVETVREHIETLPEDARGWLSGLRDAHIGEALRLVHARPKENWTLDRLAHEVGLSRTAFATRFVHFVGVRQFSMSRVGVFNSQDGFSSNRRSVLLRRGPRLDMSRKPLSTVRSRGLLAFRRVLGAGAGPRSTSFASHRSQPAGVSPRR